MIILSIISILVSILGVVSVVMYETNISDIEWLDAKTNKTYRWTKVWGKEVQIWS
jgi:hypothetical protein